jgi:hypothetical protein
MKAYVYYNLQFFNKKIIKIWNYYILIVVKYDVPNYNGYRSMGFMPHMTRASKLDLGTMAIVVLVY